MTKAPFFISPPRTRSSVLYHLMEWYAIEKLGLLPLKNHPELFLEFSQNNLCTNLRTGETTIGELYPVIHDNAMHVHFVSPPIFSSTVERNIYKLDVLKQARALGNEFYVKGSVPMVETPYEILDFFKDRHIVITKRRDIETCVLSYICASTTRIFHARPNNLDSYKNTLEEGVVIDESKLPRLHILLDQIYKLWNLEEYLKEHNFDYSVVYYEDLDNYDQIFNVINNLYGTSEWINYLPDDYEKLIPIKVEKDYTKCILNYDSIISNVRQQIKDAGLL